MKRTAAITALAVVVILGIAYIVLGGFSKVPISKVDIPGYTFAGQFYKGNAQDEQLLTLFNQVKQYHVEGKINGTLAAVYYDTTGKDKGVVKAFIGVIVSDSLQDLPESFTYQYIREQPAVRATIQSHYIVAPAPERVREKMIDFAQTEKLQLQNFMIEQYLNERNIILEIPVKTQ